jgi:L-amino acid N-acyltransferase YncA
VIIRPMIDGDWEQIYPFFHAIVAAGETYAYPEDLSSADARRYWVAAPPGRTVVAVDEDVVVGSATMGPNRPGRGSHVATASFMVDPDRQGRGTGRALGLDVLEWARSSGYRAIQFNAVVETNSGAVRLWQSLGFEILATVPEAFDHRKHGYVGLHVMYLPLAESGEPRRVQSSS